MSDLPFDVGEQPTSRTVVTVTERKCLHPRKFRAATGEGYMLCTRCEKHISFADSKRGKQSRNYGNRAELDVARRYGGEKIGHAGGPVDVRGAEWNVQVKTHRRKPPAEWTTAFGKMAASTDRLPRLLLRFVRPGGVGPDDYWVIPAKAWLDWYGKDEETPR